MLWLHFNMNMEAFCLFSAFLYIAYLSFSPPVWYMDGIKHKWADPNFDDFDKISRCNMKYMIKRINEN